MKRLLLVGLGAAALAGCATPQYPVTQDYKAPPPITPKYPITPAAYSQPAAQTAPTQSDSAEVREPAVQTESAPSGTSAAPSPAPVESSPLAPVATAPESKPAQTPPVAAQPAASPPPAASSPPPAAAPATTPPPVAAPAYKPPPVAAPAYKPAPEAYAPPERVRKAEVRYVTDGRVVAAHGMYRDYEVQSGDHLDAIARDLNTTREELISANHLRRPYRILPGQHIKTPVSKAYVAVSGDTLAGVAKRFGVSLGELANLNDLPQHGRLTPGIYIGLPAHYDDRGPSRETVTEEVYARPRPRATYETSTSEAPPIGSSTPNAGASEPYAPGPYTPSASALAAAAARREEANHPPVVRAYPTYESPRPAEAPADMAALARLAQGKFIWPVKGQVLSPFGASGEGRRNDGVDIGAAQGSPVQAVAVGEVVYAGDKVPGFGNLVLIKHAGGWVSAYAHLGSVSVHMQETVYQGEEVGTVGETGGVSQPQLHFELRYAPSPTEKAKPLDPLVILPK